MFFDPKPPDERLIFISQALWRLIHCHARDAITPLCASTEGCIPVPAPELSPVRIDVALRVLRPGRLGYGLQRGILQMSLSADGLSVSLSDDLWTEEIGAASLTTRQCPVWSSMVKYCQRGTNSLPTTLSFDLHCITVFQSRTQPKE